MRIKENKQLNIRQKQNYPGSVASYDSRPGNEVGLFYNSPERHTGPKFYKNNQKSIWYGHYFPTTLYQHLQISYTQKIAWRAVNHLHR